MRRVLLVLLVVPVGLLAGCGGTPQDSARRQIDFIASHGDLKDAQLAKACPSLYPRDFLRLHKHYRYDEKDLRLKVTPQQKAAARAAGCTATGTKPQ